MSNQATLNPYVNFNGRTREAMNFYKDCIGGELSFMTIKGSPIEAHMPAEMGELIMHSTLINGPILLMGSDMPDPNYSKGNNFTLSLNCTSEEQIKDLFGKIAAGGKVVDELGIKFWGGMFGVIIDKFDVQWMFNFDPNQK